MSFPEFDSTKKKILFFSRGRGRGHAAPDIEIIDSLHAMRPDIEVRAVSYASGAAAFLDAGAPFISLDLPETSPTAEMSVLAGRLIGWLNPDVVISHEEFAALPTAKIFHKPTILITDWFADPEIYAMEALKFADHIVFLGSRGLFEEPPWVHGKVNYVGMILRKFRYSITDRTRAREDLGLEDEDFVLSIFPGSWREEDTPIADIALAAFDLLPFQHKKLIWLAGRDIGEIGAKVADRAGALLFEQYRQIDQLIAATDVAITKTNRNTVYELQRFRIPNVAISFGLNPIDDHAVRALNGVVCLDGDSLDAARLANEIERAFTSQPERSELNYCGVGQCAKMVSEQIDRFLNLQQSAERG